MSLSEIILAAVSSSDSNIQKQAEQEITIRRNADPQSFFRELAQITSNEGESDDVRQTAGTIISRNIFSTLPNCSETMWSQFNPTFKNEIRTYLLGTLGSNKERPKRAACDAISKIASIDVPSGEWSDILPALVQTANNTDPNVKRTAIMTLGFICVEFKQMKVNLSTDQSERIFTAVYLGLLNEISMDIRKESLIALSHCICYMQNILADNKIRGIAIKNVISCFYVSALCQHALEVFLEYAKFYYQYLGEIIEELFNITSELFKNNDSHTVTALELWNTIANQYLDLLEKEKSTRVTPHNYLQPLADRLIQIILTCLVKVEKDEDNNVREAAYRTMCSIAEVCENSSIDLISDFVSNTIQSENWKIRQAAVLAFSALSNCKSKSVKVMFESVIDRFFNLLNDKDDFVVEASLIGLSKLLEVFSSSILQKTNWKNYIDILTRTLSKDDTIATSACVSLGKITEVPHTATNHLTEDTFYVLNIMSQYLFKTPPPSMQAQQAACVCIVNLIQHSRVVAVTAQYVQFIMNKLADFREIGELETVQKNCCLHILHSGILALRDENVGVDFLHSVTNMTINHFKKIQNVDMDGLYVVGALSITGGSNYISCFEQLYPYIIHALAMKNDFQLYKTALGVISDVSRSIGGSVLDRSETFLSILINDFSGNTDRSIKGPILATLGDLIATVRDSDLYARYLPQVMKIVTMSFVAAISLCQSNEDPEYIDELKETLIDICECVTSCSSDNNTDVVCSLVPLLKEFVIMTCNKSQNPSLDYFVRSLTSLFDLSSCMMSYGSRDKIQEVLRDPALVQIYNHLKDCPQEKEVKELIHYGRTIFTTLKINIY